MMGQCRKVVCRRVSLCWLCAVWVRLRCAADSKLRGCKDRRRLRVVIVQRVVRGYTEAQQQGKIQREVGAHAALGSSRGTVVAPASGADLATKRMQRNGKGEGKHRQRRRTACTTESTHEASVWLLAEAVLKFDRIRCDVLQALIRENYSCTAQSGHMCLGSFVFI